MSETRVALVTGANRGIGLEIVRQLARLGVVAAIATRDAGKGMEAARSLGSEGLEAPVVTLDVTEPATIRAAVDELMGLFGRIDILVNNAGILRDGPSSGFGSVAETPEAIVRQTLETNVVGPLLVLQAVVPHMRAQGYGRVVNLSSGLGQLSDMGGGWPSYRMSKAALNALTRAAASELVHSNIKVNAACPGWVNTNMGGPDAPRTVEQGADTPVWLATLDDDGPTGGFFRDRKPIAW